MIVSIGNTFGDLALESWVCSWLILYKQVHMLLSTVLYYHCED